MKRILVVLLLSGATLIPQRQVLAQSGLDMLTFFVGASSTWPRTGTHYMNQVNGSYTQTFVKFGDPANYEAYYADLLGNIHFWEDSHLGFPGPYRFTDDLWMNRYMSVGDVINHPSNQLINGDRNCNLVGYQPYPYQTKLEAYWPQYNTGTDLGVRDVILFNYIPYTTTGYFERYYYARDAGWAQWEEWNNGVMQRVSTFATFGGPNTQPNPPCSAPPAGR